MAKADHYIYSTLSNHNTYTGYHPVQDGMPPVVDKGVTIAGGTGVADGRTSVDGSFHTPRGL